MTTGTIALALTSLLLAVTPGCGQPIGQTHSLPPASEQPTWGFLALHGRWSTLGLLTDQSAGQGPNLRAHGMSWMLADEDRPPIDRSGDVPGAGDSELDLGLESSLRLLRREHHLRVGAIEHHQSLILRVVQQVQHLHRQLEVLHRRQIKRGEKQQYIGAVEGGDGELVERRGSVDDDVCEPSRQLVEHRADDVVADLLLLVRSHRGDDHLKPWRVRREKAIDDLVVHRGPGTRHVGDRAGREKLQSDADIPEAEIEVHEAHLVASAIGRGARFFLVSGLIYWGGERFADFLKRRIDLIGWITVALIVLALVAWHALK